MSWVTVIFSMVASACLTLALIYGLIWWRQRNAWANLLFALAAIGTAATAATDLAMLHAESPVEWGAAVRWSHVANWLMIVPMAGFVRLYLRAGRTWLLWTLCALRTTSVILNFSTGENLNYREITRISRIPFLGESVTTIGDGVVNPWMLVGQLSLWALIAFVIDASITVWRRGDRRMAMIVGGSIVFFLLAGTAQAALLVWGHVEIPSTTSLFYIGIIAAMGYQFGSEALRAAQLATDLHSIEQQMDLAGAAAGLGMWTWELGKNAGWASAKARSLLGIRDSESFTRSQYVNRVYADDREAVEQAVERSMAENHPFEVEHRLQVDCGNTQWISARGRVERDAAGKPVVLRGVLLDVSTRRSSEMELQRLLGQLAHTSRVSMMGQLATAIAHELHQPLGAILRNAEAAELFLEHDPLDLDELRAILADIRADDRRAREVIDRLRALLKRRSIEPLALSVSDLLPNIGVLTRADAAARGISVEIESRPGLPSVMGDAVHLQQVLLNLVLNAMDAIDGAKSNKRLITVRAEYRGGSEVEVMVSDTGPGLVSTDMGAVFEPFFTTKSNGMGMGLSISRTIIEAHGGRIWAENNAARGATFRFTLPTEHKVVL